MHLELFSIKCYTLPSILELSVNKASLGKILQECSDIPEIQRPLKVSADHEKGVGIGLVLGHGAIRDIRVGAPNTQNSYLEDRSMYGPAVSDMLRNPSQTHLSSAFTSFEDAKMSEEVLDLIESGIDNKIQLLEDLNVLSNKEILGVKQKELYYEDKLCIKRFKKGVKHDSTNKKYLVSLPFNNKKNLLPTNRYQTLIITQTLQEAFPKDGNIGLLYLYQIESFLQANFNKEILININKHLPMFLKEKAICHETPLELKVDSQLPLSNLNYILSNEESPNPDDISSRIRKQTPSLNTQSNISNEEGSVSDDTVDWVQNTVLPCIDESCGPPNCIRHNPAEKALKWKLIPYNKDFTLNEVYICPLSTVSFTPSQVYILTLLLSWRHYTEVQKIQFFFNILSVLWLGN